MIDAVTSRYTEALFRLARSRGALEAVRADVEHLSRELVHSKAGAFLFDVRLPLESRRERARALLDGLHPLTADFVHLLLTKRREAVLRRLGPAFHRRLLEERGAAEGVVESARPLPPDELSRLERALGEKLGKELHLENKLVPGLLGGVRVIVENRMLDASLQGRLEGLRRNLLAAALPHAFET